MRDNDYYIRFTFGMREYNGRNREQWWCDILAPSPAGQPDANLCLATGNADDMAGALINAATAWRGTDGTVGTHG